MFRKVGAVILLVSDMKRSVNFYKNTLGLALKSKSKDWVEFIQDGTVLALHPADKKLKPKSSKPKIGILVAFKVMSMDEVYKVLKRKRVRFMKEPTDEEFGKHAIILDPDGYMISLIELKLSKEEEFQQATGYRGFAPI
jgi:catechol 2,3-dioxygenase-like lactoylglutathione lyase family enzyme